MRGWGWGSAGVVGWVLDYENKNFKRSKKPLILLKLLHHVASFTVFFLNSFPRLVLMCFCVIESL